VLHEGKNQRNVRITEFGDRHLTPEYVSWLNNNQIVRFSEQRHLKHTLDTCKNYVDEICGGDNHLLAVECHAERGWEHVGNISIILDGPNSVADLSILIGSPLGHGIGSIAWSLAAEFAFNQLGVRKVLAGTMSVNSRMRGVFAKTGMREVAWVPSRYILEGREVAMVIAEGALKGFEDHIRSYGSGLNS